MIRLLLALILTLAIAAPVAAQPSCPLTSVEAFTPVVPIPTPPAGATNPRQARIDPIGQVVLYDYSLAGFTYVAWQPNIRQYAYVVIGDATVGPPGGNGTVLRLDSLCRITLLVQPAGAVTVANRADLNGDGRVDQVDFSIFAAHFGQRGAGVPGDLNGDGVVDTLDLSLFAAAFGH
jgi:hypothetical protein